MRYGYGYGLGRNPKTFSTENLIARYTQSAEGEDLVDQYGISPDIPYISGTGIDQIFDFGVLSGDQYDKGSYLGNGLGLPEIYDFPYINIYYDPTSATTRKYWKLTDFHYRWIEAQFQGTLNNIFFAKITYVSEEASTLTDYELLIYSVEQTSLTQLRKHIGINDFQNQSNWYYTNEWEIRDMLQFIVEGTNFSLVLSGLSQAVYWGDGTFDTVNTQATYSNTYAFGGKHLVSITKDITYFGISNKSISGDINYWSSYISQMTSLQRIFINSNSFTGDLSSWDISGLTSLLFFYIQDNSFTGAASTETTSINIYNISNNNINQSGIDNILAALDTYFSSNPPIKNGTFTLNGNSAPSAAGLISKSNIETHYTNAGFIATINIDT